MREDFGYYSRYEKRAEIRLLLFKSNEANGRLEKCSRVGGKQETKNKRNRESKNTWVQEKR